MKLNPGYNFSGFCGPVHVRGWRECQNRRARSRSHTQRCADRQRRRPSARTCVRITANAGHADRLEGSRIGSIICQRRSPEVKAMARRAPDEIRMGVPALQRAGRKINVLQQTSSLEGGPTAFQSWRWKHRRSIWLLMCDTSIDVVRLPHSVGRRNEQIGCCHVSAVDACIGANGPVDNGACLRTHWTYFEGGFGLFDGMPQHPGTPDWR